MSADRLVVFIPSPRRGKTGKPLPFWGMNDIMAADKSSGKRPDRQKLEAEKYVSKIVAEAMAAQGWSLAEHVEESLVFVEPHGIRDEDNVYGGVKYINDAISKPETDRKVPRHVNGCAAIVNDNRKCIRKIHLAIAEEVDRDNPGVWLRLVRLEDE
ncbi:MAG: hypothetical protein IJ781_06180 [Atopobiaceae bacterium]|nr:hypothetical protein [Atopobiaceae bacterium]